MTRSTKSLGFFLSTVPREKADTILPSVTNWIKTTLRPGKSASSPSGILLHSSSKRTIPLLYLTLTISQLSTTSPRCMTAVLTHSQPDWVLHPIQWGPKSEASEIIKQSRSSISPGPSRQSFLLGAETMSISDAPTPGPVQLLVEKRICFPSMEGWSDSSHAAAKEEPGHSTPIALTSCIGTLLAIFHGS